MQNKICYPGSGVGSRVSKILDPVNYSIDFDDGESTVDEVEEWAIALC